MTPSHTNKQGARYRYYVSHTVLQKRDDEAGSVTRISAPDVEMKVVEAVRNHLTECKMIRSEVPTADRELIEQQVERVVVKPQAIEIVLISDVRDRTDEHGREIAGRGSSTNDSGSVISLPWTTTATVATKGVLHSPSPYRAMSTDSRDSLLTAIARTRSWINDLAEGRVASFAEGAKREGKVERHIRLLAPLAFVSPAIISNIIGGDAEPVGVIELAKKMAHCSPFETRKIGLRIRYRSR